MTRREAFLRRLHDRNAALQAKPTNTGFTDAHKELGEQIAAIAPRAQALFGAMWAVDLLILGDDRQAKKWLASAAASSGDESDRLPEQVASGARPASAGECTHDDAEQAKVDAAFAHAGYPARASRDVSGSQPPPVNQRSHASDDDIEQIMNSAGYLPRVSSDRKPDGGPAGPRGQPRQASADDDVVERVFASAGYPGRRAAPALPAQSLAPAKQPVASADDDIEPIMRSAGYAPRAHR